ncbi:MAG: NADH:ubiquinone reductase (Na(+)-transporting) subunit F [Gammaproteobacteria bacterium]|nr:NADH:ubiquinone reductase (Na(+)-transporting) subunit F [Gammaproteobacteria bacterium]NIP90169.1 NADH:ubiquinone reductase (Na(+)-transporting) subunit F [Gammaproteobacteria bacterium]NIR24961.1 NADH:ubiquinone reductase (Na(+)-transporting) subunit F [Gammaproteobacteria bacterium]NIS06629.1 NADH:ubiquinone reductase (Na(+)-transporting) subunit F [Gammaproteobacteria bacterium]NIU40447.1 NADH:ubiquinone reductase (Na(+)-transporting) subunit F [Gammaproteobacteria bacterium]
MEIGIGIVSFTGIVLVLGVLVLLARRLLVPSGECQITVNGRMIINATAGSRLLETLAAAGVRLPSACGGAGTCGLCTLRVLEGGGEAGPQELALMTRVQALRGTRLACQVPVLEPMAVEVNEAYFGIRTWMCTVERTRNVATLIREIVLALPEGEELDFRAGGFVEITCPSFHARFAEFDIEDAYRDVWDRDKLWRLEASSARPETRAYSMANHPAERDKVVLNVRVALPPPYAANVPPGIVSSWLFSCKVGDTVEVSGPFGHFFVDDTDREAVFIGGGAGMAPLHAQILELLELRKSTRKISFWYGGRSKRELFYSETFERLAAEHDNFSWQVALSAPDPEDDWKGHVGFIHRIVYDQYLADHPAPEDCEYYLCGPPLMVKAVLAMLDDLGVEADHIHYDDFGGASSAGG